MWMGCDCTARDVLLCAAPGAAMGLSGTSFRADLPYRYRCCLCDADRSRLSLGEKKHKMVTVQILDRIMIGCYIFVMDTASTSKAMSARMLTLVRDDRWLLWRV